MQAYSITINLPEDFQDQLEVITSNFLTIIGENSYIQSYEQCKSGKQHSHIAYLTKAQKFTSNETKKFLNCYPFTKAEHPNAIKHCRHNNWELLVGYVVKDGDEYRSNLDPQHVEKCKKNYIHGQKPLKTKGESPYTVNEIGILFRQYYQDNYIPRKYQEHEYEDDYNLVKSFFKTIGTRITLNTYQRLKRDSLLEYARMTYNRPELKYLL